MVKGKKFIREKKESGSEGEEKKRKDRLGRIKEHVKSIRKMYPNIRPFTREKEDKNIRPLTREKEDKNLYPDLDKDEKATFDKQETKQQQFVNTPAGFPYYGYPPGFPGTPMMDPWYPMHHPYFTFPPPMGLAGHPSPMFQAHPQLVPQPPHLEPPKETLRNLADPSQSCPVSFGEANCGVNPADPLPVSQENARHSKPIFKNTKAPLPPLQVDDATRPERKNSIRSTKNENPDTNLITQELDAYQPRNSSLYPTLDESLAEPNLNRSVYRRSSRRGGSLRSRTSQANRSVRFAEEKSPKVDAANTNGMIKIGEKVSSIVKDAENHENILNSAKVPDSQSPFPENVTIQEVPVLRKGDHISALVTPAFNTLQRGEKISDAIMTASTPEPEKVEDTRYPNLRRITDIFHPYGDDSNYVPSLHQINLESVKRDFASKKEGFDTDEEIEEFTKNLAKDIGLKRNSFKGVSTAAELKKKLASEIKDAIINKKLIKGVFQKHKPWLDRSQSERKMMKPNFNRLVDSEIHSDDDWWSSSRGNRRLPLLRGDSSDSNSDSSLSETTVSTEVSSPESSTSLETDGSVDEDYIMRKVKLYLAKIQQKRKTRNKKVRKYSLSDSESGSEIYDNRRARKASIASVLGSLKSLTSDDADSGLVGSLGEHFRKGSTRFKRNIAASLLKNRRNKKDHSVMEHLTNRYLGDDWIDHLDNSEKGHNLIDHLLEKGDEQKFDHSLVEHIAKNYDEVSEFKAEMKQIQNQIDELHDSDTENTIPNPTTVKNTGFMSKLLKKRPKYSFPQFYKAKRKLVAPAALDFSDEDIDPTLLSYIPSRSNSAKSRSSIIDQLNGVGRNGNSLKLMKERGFKSLEDLSQINTILNKLNRSSSYDFSRKPHHTSTGYLTGHPILKKLSQSFSGEKLRRSLSGSLQKLLSRGKDSSPAYSNKICTSDRYGNEVCYTQNNHHRNHLNQKIREYQDDVNNMALSDLVHKYEPSVVRKSLEDLIQ